MAHIKDSGVVMYAGPFLDAEDKMCGSLVILDVEDMSQAEAWAANDPYAKADLFASSELVQWKKVIG